MRIKFTKLEAEILRDRLDLDDCLREVLGCEERYREDDIDAVVDALCFNGLVLDTRKADEINESLSREILAECLEGSTWIAAMIGTATEQLVGRHIAAAERLTEKLEPYIGRKANVPTW